MRPSAYNPQYHDDWAWSLAITGATNKEIAEAFGITQRTFARWLIAYPTLKEHLSIGKEVADAKVEKSLYKRALGYEYEEEQRIINIGKNDGAPNLAKICTTKKTVLPDITAAIFWLKNRRPDKWRDVNKIEHTGKDGQALGVVEILKLPDNGRDSE